MLIAIPFFPEIQLYDYYIVLLCNYYIWLLYDYYLVLLYDYWLLITDYWLLYLLYIIIKDNTFSKYFKGVSDVKM